MSKNAHIMIRIEPSDKELVKNLAQVLDTSLSEMVRSLLMSLVEEYAEYEDYNGCAEAEKISTDGRGSGCPAGNPDEWSDGDHRDGFPG